MSRTSTVTGYGVLRSTVMGTLAVPAVRRMVSERTDKPWSWLVKADSKPDSAASCWRGANVADSAARSKSPRDCTEALPSVLRASALCKAPWRARAVCRAPTTAAGSAVGVSGCRVTGCPSAPTGT